MTVFFVYWIQSCSPPLAGVFAGENERVKPHLPRAVYPFGFICGLIQFLNIALPALDGYVEGRWQLRMRQLQEK